MVVRKRAGLVVAEVLRRDDFVERKEYDNDLAGSLVAAVWVDVDHWGAVRDAIGGAPGEVCLAVVVAVSG